MLVFKKEQRHYFLNFGLAFLNQVGLFFCGMKAFAGLLVVLILLGLGSCRDKSVDKQIEREEVTKARIVTSLIANREDLITEIKSEQEGLELGTKFSVIYGGKLTELGCRMPEPGQYRVTLWDFNSKKMLHQVLVDQRVSDDVRMEQIEPITLTADKKYVVSVNTSGEDGPRKFYSTWVYGPAMLMPTQDAGIVVLEESLVGRSNVPMFSDGAIHNQYQLFGQPDFTLVSDVPVVR